MKQKPLAGNVLARPSSLREAAFDPARQFTAPFIGWPSPRKIAGEQQQECPVGLRLRVIRRDRDGAVVARKCLVEAPPQGPRGTLHVQAKTVVSDQKRCRERDVGRF